MPEHKSGEHRAGSVDRVMRRLRTAIAGMELPAIEKISNAQAEDPFQILIATLLSARTQDATTHAASTLLFRRARTPRSMAKLPVEEIEKLIYPVGFYRAKAKHVKSCCEMLVRRHQGRVPQTLEELVALPGVGRKTANLVLIVAFKSRANICVDTHVHRIANRRAMVGADEPVSRDLGAERVSADTSALRGLRDRARLPKNWSRFVGRFPGSASRIARRLVLGLSTRRPRPLGPGMRRIS